MKELVAKINAEFEAFTAETESLIDKGVKAAGARARKSTLEMEKLLKEFRKLSIEESKIFHAKSLTKMRTLLLIQLVVSRWNLLRA
jgi:ElaB/YqjD/DUF883 family membrane-anchored ribosome-binding protein